jgi:hypothetical protein
MNGIWGLHSRYKGYSLRAKDLFHALIEEQRRAFKAEFAHALKNYHKYELIIGFRFRDNGKIFWALQSNVDEVEFMKHPREYITRVLLGACSADYYYQFEKEW